jgi:monoamine oxidase
VPGPDVLVLGAGLAGLAAADRLSAAGRRVVVLEARDRVGGRVHTIDDPDLHHPVELGAEFVHGRPLALIALIAELGLSLETVPPRVRPRDLVGSLPLPNIRASLAKLLHAGEADSDQPVSELIVKHGGRLGHPGELDAVVQYVQSFHAADLSLMGSRALAENELTEDEGADELHRVREGYGALAHRLADRAIRSGADIHFRTEVRSVAWRPGEVDVRVRTEDGHEETLRAARAVIALPLGAVQRMLGDGARGLTPAPAGWAQALATLHLGPAHRVSLGFDERWWAPDGGRGPGFIRGTAEAFPIWWTALPSEVPVITGWIGGPRAAALVGRGDSALVAIGIESLASVFGRDPGEVRSRARAGYAHDWSNDAYAGGAYSYGGVGAIEARTAAVQPVDGTLFLAGEAVAGGGNNATVHGALASGWEAARRVLSA